MIDQLADDLVDQLAKANEKIRRMQVLALKAASLIEGWNNYYKIYSTEEYVSYYHDISKFTRQLREEATDKESLTVGGASAEQFSVDH